MIVSRNLANPFNWDPPILVVVGPRLVELVQTGCDRLLTWRSVHMNFNGLPLQNGLEDDRNSVAK